MKTTITILFSLCLITGCCINQPATTRVQARGFAQATNITDWGTLEIVDKTPKHLDLDGKDCTLTATAFTHDKLFVVIETAENAPRTNAESSLGVPVHRLTLSTTVTSNTETTCYVGQKAVRFKLKLVP